jgi:hypothetical protein
MASPSSSTGWSRRQRALGVGAAVLLLATLVVTGRLLNGTPSGPAPAPARTDLAAPYRLGDSLRCPLGHPVLAMANHHSYPPGHPAAPPAGAAAVACYQTAEQATADGYPPAPLPPGALEIGGVYLVPTGPAVRAGCRRAANRVGFAVPCPGLLPTAAPGTAPPAYCDQQGGCARGQGIALRLEGFRVPPGYVGAERRAYGWLEIEAWRARGSGSGGVLDPRLACHTQRQAGTISVERARATVAFCAGELPPLGGAVVARWRQHGTAVLVSVQGWTEVNRRLVIAVATHLRSVRPAS